MISLVLAAVVSGSPAPAGWKELSTDAFSATLPGQWKLEESEVPTQLGNLKSKTWSVQTGKAYFAIATVAYPADVVHKSIPSKMLEGARDGALANIQGTLEKDFAVFIDSGTPKKKWPGREFYGSGPQGLRYAARIYLVDNELFQLICVRPTADGTDDDFKRLADSFKLKAPARAAGAPARK